MRHADVAATEEDRPSLRGAGPAPPRRPSESWGPCRARAPSERRQARTELRRRDTPAAWAPACAGATVFSLGSNLVAPAKAGAHAGSEPKRTRAGAHRVTPSEHRGSMGPS